VKNDLKTLLDGEEIGLGLFVRLAWRCSATYRHTDYLGGCNGARIRLSPQRNWTVNRHLDVAFEILEPIKNTYGSGLSWADLIILAGNTALEMAGVESYPFCGGRTDAERDDGASKFLKPKITGNFGDSLEQLKETARLMGLTQRELAVLNAGGYSIGDSFPCEGLFCPRIISSFKSINTSIQLSNLFFVRLLTESWEEYMEPQIGRKLYKAVGKDHLYMFGTDLWYKTDGELRAIAEDYYYNNTKFVTDFTSAWYKLTTVDRFSGPAGNVCWD